MNSATVAVLGSALTTTAGNKTVTATPSVGDLIIIIAVATGATTTVSDNGTGGTYTQIGSTQTGFSTSGNLQVFVRNNLVTSAVSTIYTATQTSSTGGGLVVLRVTGMPLAGSAAVRSSGGQSSGTSGTKPAPVLSLTPLLANPIITAVASGTNSTTTLNPRSGYTEDFDNGYATPATGLEVNHLVSGETSATLTQGSGTASSAFASFAIELILNSAPTSALNTPADAATGISTTPTLNLTGTDANGDAVEYEVQIDTVNTFNDVAIDSSSSSFANASGTGLTWSHTINSGNNRLLLVGISVRQEPAPVPSVSTVTFNGSNLTFLGTMNDGIKTNTEIWYMINPPVTTANIVVTMASSVLEMVCGATGWVGVHQTTPLGTIVKASGNNNNPTVTVTSALNEIIQDVMSTVDVITADGNQIKEWEIADTFLNGGGSIKAGAASVAMRWSVGSIQNWTYAAVSIKPANLPLLNKFSTTDAGFTAGHPFASGAAKDFTVQAGDALAGGTQYFWRVRAIDPSGSNSYGAWSSVRSFTTVALVIPSRIIEINQSLNRSYTY